MATPLLKGHSKHGRGGRNRTIFIPAPAPPLHIPSPPAAPAALNAIPEVILPAGWDAPLQNPIPIFPSLPVQPRRGRPRNRQQGDSRLVNQPGLVDPHLPPNIEAIREAARRQDEQWMAQMTLYGARGQYETAQSVVQTGKTEQQNRLPGNQPEFMNPYQPLDLEAVREAARRHDNQWIAQMQCMEE